MQNSASLLGTQQPHLLTTTRLCKHVASLAQVLALKEHNMDKLDMLTIFLGHKLRVYREFYRMPFDVCQVARVSKLFLTCEEGQTSEFARQRPINKKCVMCSKNKNKTIISKANRTVFHIVALTVNKMDQETLKSFGLHCFIVFW